MRLLCCFVMVLVGAADLSAQAIENGDVVLDERALLIRARYEEVLARDPLQEAAFDRVYDSYMLSEGVDAWLAKLVPPEGQPETVAQRVLRGRILARQFRVAEAIKALAGARDLGQDGPEFNLLLGRLYYETGRDADAITLLNAALDATGEPEQRSAICRMLGSVYLRSGRRDEAAATWERIAEANPKDLFALQEMAEIYEENSLWDEAIAAWKRIVEAAANDPYRQCSAWRAIGQALAAKEDFAGAISAYEQGLNLAAPGNWLFEDLKRRLVGIYESMGDLEGLAVYLEARIEQDPTDQSFRELLADVWMRRDETDKAEAVLKDILARAPGRLSASEMLITLYRQANRMDDLAAQFEVMIAQFPAEPDYIRRLGDAWLEAKQPEKAQETWRRVLGDGDDANNHALLASWLERSEFYPEAAAAYEAALALRPDREWQLRLAGLKYDMGDEAAALATWQAAVAAEETPAGEIAEIATIVLSRDFKEEARALYARAMAAAPDNLDYVLAYARLLAAGGDQAGAAEYFARLADQDENEYFKSLGESGLLDAYTALGTLEEKQAAWEAEIAEKPDDIPVRLKLARLRARAGNRPGVVKLYEACVAIAPERVDLQRLLAEAYRENRQVEKAITTFQALMEEDTGRAPAYLRELLNLHSTLGRKDDALQAAEALVERSPSNPEARTTLAQTYLRYGEQEKALQQYRDAIQLKNDEPAYLREFGDALLQANRLGEAQEIFRKMLDVAVDDGVRLDAVTRLASVYVRSSQGPVLLEEFRRKLSAAPKKLAAYRELAAVYQASGNPQSALETLERARGEVEDTDAVLRLVMAEAYQAGDHQKVLATYEALIARSAQPTPFELDRLASAYAMAGRLDDAMAVWERIGQENKDDASAQLMVARAMEDNGLFDESRPYIERALELDPYNYVQRFNFAQQLLNYNEVDQALAQMKLILEIGEKPVDPADASATAPPAPATYALNPRNPQQPVPQRSRGRNRTFEDFRGQVVQAIVQTSARIDGVEPVLEAYRKQIEDHPENIDARRDYLLVCEAAGKQDLALEAARELSRMQPEDSALRWRILGYLQEIGEVDEATQLARDIAENADEAQALQAKMILVRLYSENKQAEEAEALVKQMTEEQPDQAALYLQFANAIQESARLEFTDGLYLKAAELDPRYLIPSLRSRSSLYLARGDTEKARALLIEAVFAPDVVPDGAQQAMMARATTMAARRGTALHVPQTGMRGRQSSGNIAQLPGFMYPAWDYQRTESLNAAWQMTREPEEFAPVFERLRGEADKYLNAQSDLDRQYAGYFVAFLAACLRNTGQTEEALEAVQPLAIERPGDIYLQNLVLYLLEDLARFDEMEPVYARVEEADPALAQDVANARLQLAIAQNDVDAIPALYRALPAGMAGVTGPAGPMRVFGRATVLSPVVHALQNAGAHDAARALLDEELTQSRDEQVLLLASRAYALENDHDKAIALAREAWQKQSGGGGGRGRAFGRNLHYSQQGISLQQMGLNGLEFLWNAYREAGREQELIDEFKERLEGQPTAVTLHQSLIGLYLENRQYDLARAQMETLLALRPNDVQLKVRYAGLLESNNDPEGALAVLETIAASRPSAARNITREIQRLYQELGKTEALEALQERRMREARSVNDLQELAQEMGRAREFAKAAELLERAFRMEPTNSWIQYQMADYAWQAEQRDKAIDAYLEYFHPSAPNVGLYVDVARMPQVIQRFEEAGRLDELKAVTAAGHPDEFTARSLKITDALIARHEKRLDDAENILKGVIGDNSDPQSASLLADLAEARGDLPAAVQYLESVSNVQGNTDFRRLATLSLRMDDTDQAIRYWKKFAEQHGGYLGHDDAIRSLSEAGATEAVKAYFLDVYHAIPAADPARRQLAEALIRANRDTGWYDALIDAEVFTATSRYAPELARDYAGDFNELPGVARRRIAPIAERFPENLDIQRILAQIFEELGEIDGALAIYERLMEKEDGPDRNWEHYADLLRRTGQPEKRRELVLSKLRTMKNPGEDSIRTACDVLRDSGTLGELPALRDVVLANAEPGQRPRIRAAFAIIAADYGDRAGAYATMKTMFEESPDATTTALYGQFLLRFGWQEEAAQLAQTTSGSDSSVFLRENSRAFCSALLATGGVEAAFDRVLDAMRQSKDRPGRNGGDRMLSPFQEYNVAAHRLDQLLEPVKAQETLPLKERVFLAEYAIALGRWPAALGLLVNVEGNNQVAQWREQALQQLPPEIRERLIPDTQSPQPGSDEFQPFATPPVPSVPLENDGSPVDVQIRTARTQATEGHREAALETLDAIVLTGEDATRLPQRARAYSKAGAFDKAISDLSAHLTNQPDDNAARVQLARTQVEAGRVEEAMATWKALGMSNRSGNAPAMAELLLDHDASVMARTVLEDAGPIGSAQPRGALLLARCLLDTGDRDGAVAQMELGYAGYSENMRNQFTQEYANLLHASGLWKELLAGLVHTDTPCLIRALLKVARQYQAEGENEAARTIMDGLGDLGRNQWPGVLDCAQLLADSNRRDEAIAALVGASTLIPVGERNQRSVVDALYHLGAYPEAIQALRVQADRFPHLISDTFFVIQLFDRAPTSAPANALFELLLARATSDSDRDYLLAWRAARVKSPEDPSLLEALLDLPNLNHDQYTRLAEMFTVMNRYDLAIASLDHIAAGTFGSDAADIARLRMIEHYGQLGDFENALRVYSELLPARRSVVASAHANLRDAAAEREFEETNRLILERVSAQPTAPGVSDLLALRAAIAAEKGIAALGVDLVAMGVPPVEIEEARLWSNLVTMWLVSEPIPIASWTEMSAPLDEHVAAAALGETTTLTSWKPARFRTGFPIFSTRNVELKNSNGGGNSAHYGLVHIESPDARTVTLAHGSADWTRIWVNGEEVLSNPYTRSNLLDTDRAEVALHPGVNTILVKTRSGDQDGAFSLSIVENGDGLVQRMPVAKEEGAEPPE